MLEGPGTRPGVHVNHYGTGGGDTGSAGAAGAGEALVVILIVAVVIIVVIAVALLIHFVVLSSPRYADHLGFGAPVAISPQPARPATATR